MSKDPPVWTYHKVKNKKDSFSNLDRETVHVQSGFQDHIDQMQA